MGISIFDINGQYSTACKKMHVTGTISDMHVQPVHAEDRVSPGS